MVTQLLSQGGISPSPSTRRLISCWKTTYPSMSTTCTAQGQHHGGRDQGAAADLAPVAAAVLSRGPPQPQQPRLHGVRGPERGAGRPRAGPDHVSRGVVAVAVPGHDMT